MLCGYVPEYLSCGDRLLAVEETLSLCGLAGFFKDYVPVFLARRNVYRTRILQEGGSNFARTTPVRRNSMGVEVVRDYYDDISLFDNEADPQVVSYYQVNLNEESISIAIKDNWLASLE